MDKVQLGFKSLCLDNWMLPDPLMNNLVMLKNGVVSNMSANDWAIPIFEPKLTDNVPSDILKLFEVARGLMLYGYFFYPIYTMAYEQLTRIAETSINHKCKEMGYTKPKGAFAQKIDWLEKNAVISDKKKWHDIRELRNKASHPNDQTIITPNMAIDFLETITECINSLYASQNQV